MSTDLAGKALGAALFGHTRRAVLALLYTHPDERFFLRQISRRAGISPGSLHRELIRLAKAGILQRNVSARQVHYQANPECPIFPELKSLVIKTVGMGDVLRSALEPMRRRIEIAFVYGSVARGDWRKQSDVDLLIVGDVDFSEVVAELGPSQKVLGREVNPTVYSSAEFKSKLAGGHHFLSSVLDQSKLFLIGGERELAKLGPKRVAHGASK